MSAALRDIVGQSLMLSFPGTEATPEVFNALALTRANGVILFAHNIRSPRQVHELNHALQRHAARIGLPPLLIGIDQEGGIVSRLPAPLVTVPSSMAQAATGDPASAKTCASITARQLQACGVNTNFAPVLDVNNNPANPVIGTRAFGDQPAQVIAFGQAALQGYTSGGIIPVVKHFPGHGDTSVDSHLGLPTVAHGRQRLDHVELAPFKAMCEAGVPAVMTAHVIFAALDHLPATLSRAILTDLLRHQFDFDGVIFTDALNMQAIAAMYPPSTAARLAKAAGADVVLPLGTLDEQTAVAAALCDAVVVGELPVGVFTATARRLDALRKAYNITYELPQYSEPGTPLYNEALAIARHSITVVHGSDVLPPAPHTRLALIDCLLPRFSLVEEAYARAETLIELAQGRFPNVRSMTVGAEPTVLDVDRALVLARQAEAVLLITRNASLSAERTHFVQALGASPTPVIHVAAGLPYDANLLGSAAATVLTYGDPAVSLAALVDVLAGAVTPQGRVPVTLNSPTAEGTQ